MNAQLKKKNSKIEETIKNLMDKAILDMMKAKMDKRSPQDVERDRLKEKVAVLEKTYSDLKMDLV